MTCPIRAFDDSLRPLGPPVDLAFTGRGRLIVSTDGSGLVVVDVGSGTPLLRHEEPTYGYFPPVYYYQGRVREGLNSEKAAESYQAYLDIRGKAGEDPLLSEVRRRAGH